MLYVFNLTHFFTIMNESLIKCYYFALNYPTCFPFKAFIDLSDYDRTVLDP